MNAEPEGKGIPAKAKTAGKKVKGISYTRIVALGYFALVIVGTLLLMLPVSSKSGLATPFFDALTTATSASCVTGLIVYDTFTHWSIFGQLVILALIQIGGLGYMTVIALLSVIFRRRISVRERRLLKESTNSLYIGGLIALTKRIISGTVIFEGLGAVVLSVRFAGIFGLKRGIYYGIFHSVSAFCNAGFDLMGIIEPYSSMTYFNSDPVVLITLSILIIMGGIGFMVWDDAVKNKLRFRKYSLHSKIAVVTSLALILFGSVTIFGFEYNGALAGMSAGDKILNSVFASISARTAGFNSFELSSLTPGSTLVNVLLMLIGGSPGSTAGGLKTTTFAVLIIAARANIRNRKHVNVFGRRLENDIIRKALTVSVIYMLFAFASVLLIGFTNPSLSLDTLAFEISSAIGTVGLSAGGMSRLNLFGQLLITLLMYCGRVGSMSFAMVFTEDKAPTDVMMPSEKIVIG
ncbi:MAG: Trk family potassium uptake protein [Clostridiales bacterium]|nr:Trk family potassium uptake protein [Clostridiales bacterium]